MINHKLILICQCVASVSDASTHTQTAAIASSSGALTYRDDLSVYICARIVFVGQGFLFCPYFDFWSVSDTFTVCRHKMEFRGIIRCYRGISAAGVIEQMEQLEKVEYWARRIRDEIIAGAPDREMQALIRNAKDDLTQAELAALLMQINI